MRFTGTGDVEVFDGSAWQPVDSLLRAAGVGDRDAPATTPSDDADPQPEPSPDDPR
jgi:hypothetical protein